MRFSHSSALCHPTPPQPLSLSFSFSFMFAYSIASQWLHSSPCATLVDGVPCDHTDTSNHKAHPKLKVADLREKREDMSQKEHNKQTKSSSLDSVNWYCPGTLFSMLLQIHPHVLSETTTPFNIQTDLLCLTGLAVKAVTH